MVIQKANMALIQAFTILSSNSLTQKIKPLKIKNFLSLIKPLLIECQPAHLQVMLVLLEELNHIKKI